MDEAAMLKGLKEMKSEHSKLQKNDLKRQNEQKEKNGRNLERSQLFWILNKNANTQFQPDLLYIVKETMNVELWNLDRKYTTLCYKI